MQLSMRDLSEQVAKRLFGKRTTKGHTDKVFQAVMDAVGEQRLEAEARGQMLDDLKVRAASRIYDGHKTIEMTRGEFALLFLAEEVTIMYTEKGPLFRFLGLKIERRNADA